MPLAGQATVQLSAGATYSTALVDDGVLSTKLRPAIAPTVALDVAYPTGKGPYRALAEVTYARAPLNVINTLGTSTDGQLAAVATVTTLVLFEGKLLWLFRWQLGGGAVFYLPTANEGVFQNGGTHRWMLAGGVVWSRQITETLKLQVTGRVDTHTFTTSALGDRGYAGSQSVQRLGLRVGIERRL
ncbi:MAG: hypothetical protein ACREK8_12030 [Gemmatimonadales bacterium]